MGDKTPIEEPIKTATNENDAVDETTVEETPVEEKKMPVVNPYAQKTPAKV